MLVTGVGPYRWNSRERTLRVLGTDGRVSWRSGVAGFRSTPRLTMLAVPTAATASAAAAPSWRRAKRAVRRDETRTGTRTLREGASGGVARMCLRERVDLGAVQPAVAALPEMGFEELALELGQLVIDLERDARARPFAGQLRSSARLHVQLRRGGTREVRAPAGCKRNAPSAQRSPQDYRRRQSRPRPARAA